MSIVKRFATLILVACMPVWLACSAGHGNGGFSGSSQGPGGASGSGSSDNHAGTLSFGGDLGLGGLPGGPTDVALWQYDGAYKDSSLPDDVKAAFDGAPTTSQRIVYPLDGSMHPMNLGDIVFQWSRSGASSSVFRIDAVGAQKTRSFYVTCSQPGMDVHECTYPMPANEWTDLGSQEKGGRVQFTVYGTDGKHGPVEATAPITLTFSPEPVLGGLYYWSSTLKAIKRADFGSKKAVPFIAPRSKETDFGCVACHSVSRDGSTIAFAVTEQAASGAFLANAIQASATASPDQPFVRPTRGVSPANAAYPRTANATEPQDQFGDNVALSPDGSVAFVNGADFTNPPNDKYVELRDTKTGKRLAIYPTYDPLFGGLLPIHPEWSPDGSAIAVTLAEKYGGCQWTFFSCKSAIAVIPFDKAKQQLGKPRLITQPSAGLMDFYPTWSPDGKYLAFVSAPMPPMKAEGATDVAIGSSNGNQRGVLRLVRIANGPHACPSPDCFELSLGTTYTLAQAMGSDPVAGSTWPKFAPFAQGAGQQLMFITFTSRLPYGYLGKHAEEAGASPTQLWMFAIDTAKLGQGDASFAPLWLPYQDLTDGSLTPYWTEVLPCSADANGGCKGCSGGEQCIVDSVKNTCHCSTVVR